MSSVPKTNPRAGVAPLRLGALVAVTGLCTLFGCDAEQSKPTVRPGAASSAPQPSAMSSGPVLAATSAGTATESASGSQPPGDPDRPARPLNVLFITIDALRADMPWQGYGRKCAPFLTKLAAESVVYENAYSVSSYTAKSVSAILSGRYPSTLYRTGYFFTAFTEANVWFSELLQKAGVRTMAGHAHKYFDRGMKLRQGFDLWQMVPGVKWHPETDHNVTSDKMTDMAIEMLGKPENTGKQFFAWYHYGDPHDQYIQHAESPTYGRRNRDRYDAEIYFVDLHLKRLLEWAQKQSWYKNTAVIIGSDHGEAFGEHNQWKHAFALWEVLVHVPLIFKVPGAKPQRIDAYRSYIDITPTIMDLMGQKPYDGFMGKSLVPEMFGAEKPQSREPIVMELPADSHNPPTRAMIKDGYKLIVDLSAKRFFLYNIKKDKGERRELSRKEPDKLKEMKKLYEQTWAKIPSILPYGGNKLKGGAKASGPMGPPKKTNKAVKKK